MYTERPYTSFPKFCEGRQKARESAKARHARENTVVPLAATPVEKEEASISKNKSREGSNLEHFRKTCSFEVAARSKNRRSRSDTVP